MKRYNSYKDSGVEWIGEVPSHWKVLHFRHTIKHITTGLNPRDNFKLGEGKNFYVTIKNFQNGKIFLDDNCDLINDKALKIIHNRSKIQKGDLLFASISENGKAVVIKEEPINWDINESVFAIRPNNRLNSDYLFYVITDYSFYKPLRIGATGTTFSSIKQDQLKSGIIVCPPFSEQQIIASYLDSKCGEIDKVISTQEKRIALLQELKQSIITHAVTKGLNHDVKMKDSGIEWIGEVPEHWEICKIKNILIKGKNGIKIGPFGSSLTGNVGEGLPYKLYGQWNIIDRDFTAGTNTINQNVYNRLANYKVVEGDILVSMMGTIGKCATVPENIKEGVMDSHVVKISLNKSVFDNRYFEFFYDKDYSNIAFNEINKLKGGSIMDGLNSSIIKNLSITVPPLYEQQEIASYLDKRCAQIDASISKAQKEIELLQEYKQSLITEVVTGKRKVC